MLRACKYACSGALGYIVAQGTHSTNQSAQQQQMISSLYLKSVDMSQETKRECLNQALDELLLNTHIDETGCGCSLCSDPREHLKRLKKAKKNVHKLPSEMLRMSLNEKKETFENQLEKEIQEVKKKCTQQDADVLSRDSARLVLETLGCGKKQSFLSRFA